VKKILMINASFLAGVLICLFVYIGIPTLTESKNYPLASALAIIMSATIALFSAFLTINNTNKRTREKNTIDVIGQGKGQIGSEYLFIKDFLQNNSMQKEEALKFLAKNNIKFKEMHPILDKLNELEHLCEGLFKGFYDEEIIKNTRGTTIIRVWERLEPYMLERRKIQSETTIHQSFNQKPETQPFYWLESTYKLFIGKDKKDNELKILLWANILLLLPCLPAIIAICQLVF
jgi:hypothetical protein